MAPSVGGFSGSVPSGYINVPNQDNTNAFDLGSQGIQFLGSLVKLSRARKDDHRTMANETINALNGMNSHYDKTLKSILSTDPNDPLANEAWQVKEELQRKLDYITDEISKGKNFDKTSLAQYLGPESRKLTQIEAQLIANTAQRNQAMTLAEASPIKKEVYRAARGQPTVTEESRAGLSQAMSAGALTPGLPLQDQATNILGAPVARTKGEMGQTPEQFALGDRIPSVAKPTEGELKRILPQDSKPVKEPTTNPLLKKVNIDGVMNTQRTANFRSGTENPAMTVASGGANQGIANLKPVIETYRSLKGDDKVNAYKQIIKAAGHDPSQYTPNQIIQGMSALDNNLYKALKMENKKVEKENTPPKGLFTSKEAAMRFEGFDENVDTVIPVHEKGKTWWKISTPNLPEGYFKSEKDAYLSDNFNEKKDTIVLVPNNKGKTWYRIMKDVK